MDNKRFISNDVFLGIFAALMAVIFLVQTMKFPEQVRLFPSLALILALIFSLWIAGMGVYKSMQVRRGIADYTNPEMKKQPFIVLASIVIYVICMQKIGFFVTTAVYLPCAMLLFGQRKPIPMIGSTVGVLLFIYWLFVIQLKVYMPAGILF